MTRYFFAKSTLITNRAFSSIQRLKVKTLRLIPKYIYSHCTPIVVFLFFFIASCGSQASVEHNSATIESSVVDSEADQYFPLIEKPSVALDNELFYGYIPDLNVIATYNLTTQKMEKVMECGIFCTGAVDAVFIPEHSDKALIFSNNKLKGVDLINDSIGNISQLTITSVDNYFSSPDGVLYGFLDASEQKINIFRVSGNDGLVFGNGNKIFYTFSTGMEGASFVRSAPFGRYIAAIDRERLKVNIFTPSLTITATGNTYSYSHSFTSSISDLTALSADQIGKIQDAQFTSTEGQILLISSKGFLVNLLIQNSNVALIETHSLGVHLARLNPDSDLGAFRVTYWANETEASSFGIIRYVLNGDNKVSQSANENFFEEKDSANFLCEQPIQIVDISSSVHLLHCYSKGWLYYEDSDNTNSYFLPEKYDPRRLTPLVLFSENKIAVMENYRWGKVTIFDLTTKTETTFKDFFLDTFFN